MTLTHSFWSGAKEEIVALRTNDPKLVLEMAERWFMSDHKAKFVSVAIDSYSTIDGIRTAAVIISARPRDFSSRMLVFLPYTPKTENSPTVLAAPLVDFPAEYAALQPQRDYALEHVLRGRDGHPLSKPRVP